MVDELVTAEIRTRHPEHYVLVNTNDGTRWRLTQDGRWQKTVTRRQYLTIQALERGAAGYALAVEAVASTALEHPEWDMDEERTWQEWERPGR